MIKKHWKLLFATASIAFGVFFAGCSNKITQEQLMQLRELRKQERSLSELIDKKKADKSKFERELNARKAELKDCEERTQFVKDKLAKWPDVWPDWKYVEPKQEPESAPAKAPKTKTRKK
jgi:septal ring factor EnvC (AmiA/AmiB activator)